MNETTTEGLRKSLAARVSHRRESFQTLDYHLGEKNRREVKT